MQRMLSIVVAAAVAVSAGTTSFVPANALPMIAPATVADAAPRIEKVRARQQRYRYARRHHRPRHVVRHYYHRPYYRSHRHHHHHGSNVGLAVTLGVVGLAAGAIAGSQYYGGSWHSACARKYNSFNWNTGMYLGYDGYWHRCVLP